MVSSLGASGRHTRAPRIIRDMGVMFSGKQALLFNASLCIAQNVAMHKRPRYIGRKAPAGSPERRGAEFKLEIAR